MRLEFYCINGHLIKEKTSEPNVALDIKDRDVIGIHCEQCGSRDITDGHCKQCKSKDIAGVSCKQCGAGVDIPNIKIHV